MSATVDSLPSRFRKISSLPKDIYQGKVQTCSITAFSNSSVGTPSYANWGSKLLIVGKVFASSTPTSLGFFLAQGSSSFPGLVDLVVYNSTSSGAPQYLLTKMSNINLTSFAVGSFGCVPLSLEDQAKLTVSGYYWIGFYNQASAGKNVIARQPTASGGVNYDYAYVSGSPSVGNLFPSPNSETRQLIMGFGFGSTASPTSLSFAPTATPSPTPQSCHLLNCGSCTASSSCVWCLTSGSCIQNTQTSQCFSWTRNPNLCSPCTQYNSCSSCTEKDAEECAWCKTTGSPSICIEEKYDGNCTTAIRENRFCNL